MRHHVRRVAPVVPSTLALLVIAAGCASESHRTVEIEPVESHGRRWDGPRTPLAIGNFENRSSYMRGMLDGGTDRLGGQARTILETHLSQADRFTVVDRANMEEIAREAAIAGREQKLIGAEVVVTGQVTEFGRRETGDHQLFGIAGRGKTQTAYAKVSLNVVDVRTSQVLHSVQGAGEYALSDREVLGFGSSSGYDSTLNGKVLDLAIQSAVNALVRGFERGEWGAAGGR